MICNGNNHSVSEYLPIRFKEEIQNVIAKDLLGIVKDSPIAQIPEMGMIISIINTVKSVVECKLKFNTLSFLQGVVNNNLSEQEISDYIAKYSNNQNELMLCAHQLLFILSDINNEKQNHALVNIYVALVKKEINISQFVELAEVSQRIFYDDYDYLSKSVNDNILLSEDYRNLRFMALGIVKMKEYGTNTNGRTTVNGHSLIISNGVQYELTDFGKLFVQIAKV